jgi:hypothetical protein
VGRRLAWRPPIRSSAWLPVSARECTASASMDEDVVIRNATNLVTAMPRLASNAAMIALVPLSTLIARSSPLHRERRGYRRAVFSWVIGVIGVGSTPSTSAR